MLKHIDPKITTAQRDEALREQGLYRDGDASRLRYDDDEAEAEGSVRPDVDEGDDYVDDVEDEGGLDPKTAEYRDAVEKEAPKGPVDAFTAATKSFEYVGTTTLPTLQTPLDNRRRLYPGLVSLVGIGLGAPRDPQIKLAHRSRVAVSAIGDIYATLSNGSGYRVLPRGQSTPIDVSMTDAVYVAGRSPFKASVERMFPVGPKGVRAVALLRMSGSGNLALFHIPNVTDPQALAPVDALTVEELGAPFYYAADLPYDHIEYKTDVVVDDRSFMYMVNARSSNTGTAQQGLQQHNITVGLIRQGNTRIIIKKSLPLPGAFTAQLQAAGGNYDAASSAAFSEPEKYGDRTKATPSQLVIAANHPHVAVLRAYQTRSGIMYVSFISMKLSKIAAREGEYELTITEERNLTDSLYVVPPAYSAQNENRIEQHFSMQIDSSGKCLIAVAWAERIAVTMYWSETLARQIPQYQPSIQAPDAPLSVDARTGARMAEATRQQREEKFQRASNTAELVVDLTNRANAQLRQIEAIKRRRDTAQGALRVAGKPYDIDADTRAAAEIRALTITSTALLKEADETRARAPERYSEISYVPLRTHIYGKPAHEPETPLLSAPYALGVINRRYVVDIAIGLGPQVVCSFLDDMKTNEVPAKLGEWVQTSVLKASASPSTTQHYKGQKPSAV